MWGTADTQEHQRCRSIELAATEVVSRSTWCVLEKDGHTEEFSARACRIFAAAVTVCFPPPRLLMTFNCGAVVTGRPVLAQLDVVLQPIQEAYFGTLNTASRLLTFAAALWPL